ncbi:MAG: PDZ domain-containing protein [Bacilli bacterium]|nr:PDZ domain-containing protein [Bacilli bacterium]
MKKVLDFIKNNFIFCIVILLIVLLAVVRLPYDVEMPGGTIDLGNRVKVNGESVDISGSFNMAYVSVVQGSIPHIVAALVIPDWDIVPQSESTYENETIEDSNKRDRLLLEQSKDYAIVTAMQAAGVEYEIENKVNYVAYISTEADTTIKVGDNIIECDGEEVEDLNYFKEIVNKHKPGDKLDFVVIRDGKKVDATGVVYEEDGSNYIGLMVLTTFDIKSDMKVEIDSKSSESGPSGGMMMALMVYNAITKQDLTKGMKVVGTGTISLDGSVGEIGGVKYKLMGAVRNKADVFLVPEGNYDEAMEVKKKKKYDIEIVKVTTLQDAIDYLEKK